MNIRKFLATSVLILGTITTTAGISQADVVGGPYSADRLIGRSTLQVLSSDITILTVLGGRQFVVTVAAKTSLPLIVSILNPDGTVRVSETVIPGFTLRKYWFDVAVSAQYKIVVTNPSPVFYGEYSLTTN